MGSSETNYFDASRNKKITCKHEFISPDMMGKVIGWQHTGFSVLADRPVDFNKTRGCARKQSCGVKTGAGSKATEIHANFQQTWAMSS